MASHFFREMVEDKNIDNKKKVEETSSLKGIKYQWSTIEEMC